jgi:hypothetical protein
VDATVALELEQATQCGTLVATASAVPFAPLEHGPRSLELAQVALVVLVGEGDETAQGLARLAVSVGSVSGAIVVSRAPPSRASRIVRYLRNTYEESET